LNTKIRSIIRVLIYDQVIKQKEFKQILPTASLEGKVVKASLKELNDASFLAGGFLSDESFKKLLL